MIVNEVYILPEPLVVYNDLNKGILDLVLVYKYICKNVLIF